MSGRVRKRAKELTSKLTSDPFFPLLFLSEAVKNGTFHLLAGSPPLDVVAASVGMSVASVVGWLYTSDDVAWGIQRAAEAVDEVTEE